MLFVIMPSLRRCCVRMGLCRIGLWIIYGWLLGGFKSFFRSAASGWLCFVRLRFAFGKFTSKGIEANYPRLASRIWGTRIFLVDGVYSPMSIWALCSLSE